MTGMYAMHYAISGCPIAARNKASGAQSKVYVHIYMYVYTYTYVYIIHTLYTIQASRAQYTLYMTLYTCTYIVHHTYKVC